MQTIVDRLRAAGCVYAEDEAALLLSQAMGPAELEEMVASRVSGTPLEHVLGWAEFHGIRVVVEPGVFVPRRRSELLADEAVAVLGAGMVPGMMSRRVLVDMCCGSGAVGVAVAAVVHGIELHAVDIDSAAVRCARRNLGPIGGAVHQGDLYEALPSELRGRAAVIVANAPYVPSAEIETLPREARMFEPAIALHGGDDGLDVQRRIIAGAQPWLAPRGHLLIETSAAQSTATLELFADAGFDPRIAQSEELEATIVVGTRRAT